MATEIKSIYSYFSSDILFAKSENVIADDIRLNAGYYKVRNSIEVGKKLKFFPLSTIASVVFPGIFKRYLTENTKYGIKFLTTSDMMMLEPDSEKYLSLQITSNLDIYRVEENTLLVSRSGSIGNTIYVDDRIKDFALTEDALRVKPFQTGDMGFLYFYFTSDYGNDLITGKKSGAVIDHIYEDDLLKLKIPKLDKKVCEKLNDAYLKVKECRETAHKIIEQARVLVVKYNHLPSLAAIETKNLDPNNEVEIKRTNLDEFTTDFRLDAHFYNPLADLVAKNIRAMSQRFESLFDIADCSFKGSRSIRNYVDKENGVPFLSGKNIIQIRPDFKYISTTETSNLSDMIVEKNQILISRSGTLGRTVFVWKNYENFAASEHLIRVVPNSELVDEGYLYAFLSSDYGYHQLLRYKHGSVIDEITEDQISQSVIPLPSDKQQKQIGDLVRQAYDLRAEAIRIEDEAQALLIQALTKV
ncbi:MAG: restriction endonuclease subunit S [Chlorobiaceae bacterium]